MTTYRCDLCDLLVSTDTTPPHPDHPWPCLHCAQHNDDRDPIGHLVQSHPPALPTAPDPARAKRRILL